jgi:hypothetical protein
MLLPRTTLLHTVAAAFLMAASPLAWAAPSHAQLVDRFGVKAGVVSAGVTDELTEDKFSERRGMAASVFAERRLLSFLSLVGEVGYVQRGFNETLSFDPLNEEAGTRLDYLTIPVMMKLNYDSGLATLYALGGPRIDVLLNREPGVFKGFGTPPFKESRYADKYDSLAAGGTVGLGMTTPKRFPVRLLLEGRYEFDLTDSYAPDPFDIHNRAFSIVAGVAF